MVIRLGVFPGKILGEDIMAGRSQAIRAHAAVVALLVGGLSCAGKTYNDVARADVGIVDNVSTLHAAGYRRVYDDGTYQVADICRFTSSGPDADAHVAQFVQQFVGTVDDGRDDLARYKHLVTADGAGNQYVVYGTHAQQVIGVHHDGILGDSLPDGEVARLLPVHVGEA